MKKILVLVITLAVCAGILFAMNAALDSVRVEKLSEEHFSIMRTLLPGSENFTLEKYTGEDSIIRSVHKGETGYIIETVTSGYASDIRMLIGVTNEGEVVGLVVRELHETKGLGANALTDTDFLAQFLKTKGNAEVGSGIDAISGATVTSKAIARSVNSAAAYVTGADISSGATP